MQYILYLYLVGFGWKSSVVESKEVCEKLRTEITEAHLEYSDSACVIKMPKENYETPNRERL